MSSTQTLTEGPIASQLIKLCIPVIICNLLQQLYNIIDALMISHYAGSVSFAAIGVAGTLMNLFLFLLTGLCTGISILFSSLYGSHQIKLFRTEHFLALVCGSIFTLLLTIILLLLLPCLLKLIHTPADVASEASRYLTIILFGLLAAFLYNLYAALLRSLGDTLASLVILAISLFTNFCLDYILIAHCHLGIRGAAYGTVFSQLIAAIGCLIYLKMRYPQYLFHLSDCRYHSELFKKTVYLGSVSALHQCSLYIGKLLVQGVVNSQGIDMISAYTASTRIEGFLNSFGDSGGCALSIFVSQNMGANKTKRVQQGFCKTMQGMFGASLFLAIILALFAVPFTSIFAGSANDIVNLETVHYLRTIALFYFLCFFGNCFLGLFRGLGLVHIAVTATILQLSLRVLFSYLLIDSLGLAGVAVATGIGWIAIVCFQFCVYQFYTKKKHFASLS